MTVSGVSGGARASTPGRPQRRMDGLRRRHAEVGA